MPATVAAEVSELFADKDAETKLLGLMEEKIERLWSVSEFVRASGLSRGRVDRAVFGFEKEGLIQVETMGRTKVIRYVAHFPSESGGKGRPVGTKVDAARSRTS
jgi:hypothetical protein